MALVLRNAMEIEPTAILALMPYWHDLRTIRHGLDLAGGLPRDRRGARLLARGPTPPRHPAGAQPPHQVIGKMAGDAAVRTKLSYADPDGRGRHVSPRRRRRVAPRSRRAPGGARGRPIEGGNHLCRGHPRALANVLSRVDTPGGSRWPWCRHSTGGGQLRGVRKAAARGAGPIPARSLPSIDHEPAGRGSFSADRSGYGCAGSDQRARLATRGSRRTPEAVGATLRTAGFGGCAAPLSRLSPGFRCRADRDDVPLDEDPALLPRSKLLRTRHAPGRDGTR